MPPRRRETPGMVLRTIFPKATGSVGSISPDCRSESSNYSRAVGWCRGFSPNGGRRHCFSGGRIGNHRVVLEIVRYGIVAPIKYSVGGCVASGGSPQPTNRCANTNSRAAKRGALRPYRRLPVRVTEGSSSLGVRLRMQHTRCPFWL